MLVLDASALVGWIMPDEQGIDLQDLASRHDDILIVGRTRPFQAS